ncbi:MAG TPA: DUF3570 domain-containing protein [Aquabacterium sp.]|nr:DUF3570 domain-containing protein [Aquabacterium sp.]
MQLNPIKPMSSDVRGKLGLAVLTVLSSVHPNALAESTDSPTKVDSSVMHYQESAGRIATTEAVVHAKQVFDNGSSVGLKLTYDTLSGGSPNGALPSKSVQTFARPSGTSLTSTTTSVTPVQTYTTASGQVISTGGGTSSSSGPYTVAPGELPMDKSFHDQRFAGNLDWTQPLDEATTLSLGGGLSHELDFQSVSANGTLSRDFNNKNTTLSLGLNLESDSIKPIGGAPVPMTDYALFEKSGSKQKKVHDILLGVSQIMNRRWITQFNWSIDQSRGYQNDPYKILSALDTQGNTLGYVYENRPEQRTRNSLYWGNKIALDHDTIDLSWRHMSDNWGVKSDTFDGKYRWQFSDYHYIEPQFRYYKQSAANFFHYYLMQGDPLVQYASADPRLANFHAITLGLRWGMKLSENSELGLRYLSYKQTGSGPSNVPTQLQGLNLYPGLKAQTVEANFKLSF